MDSRTAQKLELALITPDAIEAWNTVVTARGLIFTLSYETHTPTLLVGIKDKTPVPWFVVNTRTFSIMKLPILDKDTFNGLRDLEDRLSELGLFITLQYTKNKLKQKFISLRLVPEHRAGMTTVLDTIKSGQVKSYEKFELNQRWK